MTAPDSAAYRESVRTMLRDFTGLTVSALAASKTPPTWRQRDDAVRAAAGYETAMSTLAGLPGIRSVWTASLRNTMRSVDEAKANKEGRRPKRASELATEPIDEERLRESTTAESHTILATLAERAAREEPRNLDAVLEHLLETVILYTFDGLKTFRIRVYIQGLRITKPSTCHKTTLRPATDDEIGSVRTGLLQSVSEMKSYILTDQNLSVVECSELGDAVGRKNILKELKLLALANVMAIRLHVSELVAVIYEDHDSGPFWIQHSMPEPETERLGFTSVEPTPEAIAAATRDVVTILSPPPSLGVALRRYRRFTDFKNPDEILDQFIILEALLADGAEITHKLSQRIANLVGDSFSSRVELFRTAKEGYGARSKIAHGRTLDAELGDVRERIRELVREVTKRYIVCVQHRRMRNSADEDALKRSLDEMCLGGPHPSNPCGPRSCGCATE